MIKMLQEKFNSLSSESSSSAPVQQSRAEKVLNLVSSFVESNHFSTESFLCLAYRVTNAPPPEELVLELQLIGGLEMLLSLYCSKEDNFSATSFCQHMQQLEINAKPARKIGESMWRLLYPLLYQFHREDHQLTFRLLLLLTAATTLLPSTTISELLTTYPVRMLLDLLLIIHLLSIYMFSNNKREIQHSALLFLMTSIYRRHCRLLLHEDSNINNGGV